MNDAQWKKLRVKVIGNYTEQYQSYNYTSHAYESKERVLERYDFNTPLIRNRMTAMQKHLLQYLREDGFQNIQSVSKGEYQVRKCTYKYAPAYEVYSGSRRYYNGLVFYVIPGVHAIIHRFNDRLQGNHYSYKYAVVCDNRMLVLTNYRDIETIEKCLKPAENRLITFKDVFNVMAKKQRPVKLK